MTISLDLWLVMSSCVLAIAGCFAASLLAGRLHTGRGTAWAWLIAGVPTLGLALWAVHFTALLAVQMPIGATFDLPLTLLSIEPTVIAAAIVLWLGREGHLRGVRLLGAVAALTAGATATRYFGLAAVRIVAPMPYDWLVFALSIALAAAVAYAALQYAGRWIVGASLLRKLGVTALIGATISTAQYLGLAASRIEPSPFSKIVSARIDHAWLGYTVACSTVTMLIALSVIALLYARSASRTKVMHARVAG
jgi:NO-binding membrane sensor protein with MHYT domain